VRRVSVVGVSGSGKSTLGRELAARLAVPYAELDAIFHQPEWTPLPEEQFRRRVAAIAAGDGWDEQESVISWAWHRYPVYRQGYAAATRDPRYAHLRFHRIATRADARRLLNSASAAMP
jgi:hypothetical protein